MQRALPYLFVIVSFLLGIAIGQVVDWAPTAVSSDDRWGAFANSPKVELLGDGELLRLTEDFAYVDPRGKMWVAKKDTLVNGASIPRVFWTIIGSPMRGKYRNAAIVHDEACFSTTETWEDSHKMFYEACRCGGVSEKKAKLMYAAVYHYGPRWELNKRLETREHTEDGKTFSFQVAEYDSESIETPEVSMEVCEKIKAFIESENPSLDEIENIDPKTWEDN
ncbi:Hypothetical protein PBC10988_30680 [Planctomycetales bacterium 10988]|nr:Hypothetical protein PBC10988_30680 [Planctomycetales bacterium 10988]